MKKSVVFVLSAIMSVSVVVGCAPSGESGKPADRIVYRENFEDKTFEEMSWTASNVLTENTADWKIKDGMLEIDNRRTANNPAPKDSYFVIVPETVMDEVVNCEDGFTVQWDFVYYNGSDAKRYITLPLFYDTVAGNSYFSYHYRICGYADFQARLSGAWLTLDEEGSEYEGKQYLKANARQYQNDKGETVPYDDVICKRVFGQEYVDGNQMLSINKRATVRIEYHPDEYIRVFMNDVYITTSSDSQLNNIKKLIGIGGKSVAIKAGGAIYGAIDNIVVAKGIGIPETSDN